MSFLRKWGADSPTSPSPEVPAESSTDTGTGTEAECDLFAVEPLDVRPAAMEPDQHWPLDALSQPAFAMDFGDAANGLVTIRAASLRGNRHLELQEPRQDAYAVLVTNETIHLAVADGVGSQQHSDIGANLAVSIAVQSSRAERSPDQIGRDVAKKLREKAETMRVPPDALATTLCWARILVGAPSQPWTVDIAEWGDTELLVYDTRTLRDGHPDWKRLPKSEGLANAVRALPRHEAITACRMKANWHPGEVFGLFTDGVAADVRHDSLLGHALAAAWHTAPSPWEFAGQIAFRYRPANDDRTAVVLWRTDHAASTEHTDEATRTDSEHVSEDR